jgi:hypothetical protein
MSNERPTENLILSGNYFKDAVDNIVKILNVEQIDDPDQELTYIRRVLDVHDYDIIKIPRTPAIAVAWQGFEETVRTIGQKHPVGVTIVNLITVYYYHDEIKDDIRKDEIRDALWEIGRILRRNSDLNGLSAEGASLEGGQIMNRIRNDIPYSGGLITMRVPVSIQTRRGVST